MYAPSLTKNGGLTMDGHNELETPPELLEWLATWSVITGFCVFFWLAVYTFAVHWSAAY
jgi:hypothetical protein